MAVLTPEQIALAEKLTAEGKEIKSTFFKKNEGGREKHKKHEK